MWPSLVSTLMLHQLRNTFRRVCWVGARPDLPPDRPVVIYANHHHFLDGHLLWLLIDHMLHRPGTTWMAEWDRFPFFAALGAQPFPPDAPARRGATVRRTARRFQDEPRTVLAYFPEGTLHAPAEGILALQPRVFAQLHRIFPDPVWWPVALHVTWWGDMNPTALLAGGTPSPEPPSDPRRQLTTLWSSLRTDVPSSTHLLLDGHRSPSEVWDLSLARSYFERYL